ncbi:MAG: phosphoglycerate kinase [Pseudomonadota bacterium]|nr:phosphoglycerate kinase [Pseudomonadota bacterium]
MGGLKYPKLEDINIAAKTVLVRTDLNVPMQGGHVTDTTRIQRLLPTLNYLIRKKCRIVLLSHFDRPGGKFVPSMSLAPLVDALSQALGGREVKFGVDCIGPAAYDAVAKLQPGEVLLLENLRFHPEEEKGDANFARELASLGDIFVNDAFSCSHRAHASITGLADYLPVAAGRLMQEELDVLGSIFSGAKKPIAAIIGGAKVSTKLELLINLTQTMDVLIIGGAMANTFLYAQGHSIGKSLYEKNLKASALKILRQAEKNGCRILLPVDVIIASELAPASPCDIVDAEAIPADGMAVDIGPASVELFGEALGKCKTIVWNGPLGAFETSPFDVSTVSLARIIASLTAKKRVRSIAGGGDTVAALNHAGLAARFSYLSTAGGAFLEWLEGKPLPGVAALLESDTRPAPAIMTKRR